MRGSSRGVALAATMVVAAVVGSACGGDSRDIDVTSGLAGAPSQITAVPGAGDGLTAIGAATKTVPADMAFVVVTPSIEDIGGGGSLSESDRATIREAVKKLGLTDDALTFDESDFFSEGGTAVQVQVDVAKLPGIAKDVADAVTDVVDNAQKGIVFAVADCPSAIGDARKEAIDKARAQATALAKAAKVELGEVVDISETPESSTLGGFSPFGPGPIGQPCGRDVLNSLSQSYFEGLQPLDSKPEVHLLESVALTFSLGDRPARVISSSGTAEASEAADEAYIIVTEGGGFSGAFPGGSRNDSLEEKKDEIVRALSRFDVPAEEIEIKRSTNTAPSSSYVSIEVPVSRLSQSGKDIVNAVEDAIEADDTTSGVIFSSSKCEDLVARARTAAIADADKRLQALGQAAGSKLGDIAAISDVSASGGDPCDTDDVITPADELFALYQSGGLELQPLDAEPRATMRVSVSMSRAISG